METSDGEKFVMRGGIWWESVQREKAKVSKRRKR
jgi:hypothetical protein